MPEYRVHRMRRHVRESFRFAAHTSGAASLKPRDYEQGGTVSASSPYAAWKLMADSESPLQVGDVLENPDGSLFIYKYVGFEEANWVVPERQEDPVPAGPPAA